jgi:hypothetical protein
MDKLKIILDFFKKYLFWFLFAATVVLVLVFWWMSTASLAKSFLQQRAKIEKKFNEVKTIDSDPQQHPTQKYIDAVNDENKKLKKGVLAVWETLHNAQKNNNSWPQDVLGKDADKVGKLGPNDSIPPELRERYQNGIKKYFPILYKIIDLRHPSETAGTGGGGGNAEPPRRIMDFRIPLLGGRRPAATPAADNADWVGVVDWDEGDRQRLEKRFDWETRPDSDVIRLRQEDLWVYETLLRVVRETNSDWQIKTDKDGNIVKDEKGNEVREKVLGKDHAQANVKRIEWIQIGADAIGAWLAADQTVFKASGAVEAPAGAASHGDARVTPAAARDTAATQDGKEQLLKDRYVDDKGAPLEADAKQPYSEFKMMPISMKLHMDQRAISKLLVECVNSPMPIEVRRVRIRPGKGTDEILDSGTSGTASPTNTGRDYTRRTMDARGSGRSAYSGEGNDEGETGAYDIPVEIQGIIYIYNQPDQNTLGTGTAAEKSAETAPQTPATTEPAKP